MEGPPLYINAALIRPGPDGMVYIDFRVRTPDDSDDELEDLPTIESGVMSSFVARKLAEELDRLLRGRPGGVRIEEVREPDVRADIEDEDRLDEGNGGRRSPT